MYSLENDFLRITMNARGAELISLVHKKTGQEYMWNANPAYWAKHSPVLFPIVGELKEGRYEHHGQTFNMSRHGFAREQEFQVCEEETSHLVFCLFSSEEIRKQYPFFFEFRISYTLKEDWLEVQYRVKNSGESPMYFSVGAHPAFRVPIESGLQYDEYELQFSETETLDRFVLAEGGLISTDTEPVLQNSSRLPLKKSLFYKDAIVFKDLRSEEVVLHSNNGNRGLRFRFPGFPYFGIWAAIDADFICLEPWCGIADSTNASQQLQEKEGIHQLEAGAEFRRSWYVHPF